MFDCVTICVCHCEHLWSSRHVIYLKHQQHLSLLEIRMRIIQTQSAVKERGQCHTFQVLSRYISSHNAQSLTAQVLAQLPLRQSWLTELLPFEATCQRLVDTQFCKSPFLSWWVYLPCKSRPQ